MAQFKPIAFKNPEQMEFVKTLRKRVDAYFKEKQIQKTGGIRIKLKALVMLALYVVPFCCIFYFTDKSIGFYALMAVIMGIGMAGIGFCVMHDANHGAFSRNKTLNKIAGFSLNFLGGNVNNWKAQHNVLHHTYTNINEYDHDLEGPAILRFSPKSERKKIHKYQFIYAWFLYGLMTISWSTNKDFEDAYLFKKLGVFKQLKTTFKREMWMIIVTRIIYFSYIIGLPLLFTDIAWWQILIGYVIVHFVAGIILAVVFQMAHIVEETKFPVPTDGTILNQWAVHQLQTTLNFSNKNRVLSWFVGGLNFQIEHHLFPNISHIHYPKIAPIVKKTADEFNLPYYYKKTLFAAMISHGKFLYNLGRV